MHGPILKNTTYEVIRLRHDIQNNQPYTNELSRVMTKVGQLSAELVGAKHKDSSSVEEKVSSLSDWYKNHFTKGICFIMKGSSIDK